MRCRCCRSPHDLRYFDRAGLLALLLPYVAFCGRCLRRLHVASVAIEHRAAAKFEEKNVPWRCGVNA